MGETSDRHSFKDWLDNCVTMKLKAASDNFNADEFGVWWEFSPGMPLQNINRFQGDVYTFLLLAMYGCFFSAALRIKLNT